MIEPIDTARLRLRAIEEGDAPIVSQLMTPGVTRWLASWPFPVTESFARERIAQMQHAMKNGHALCFAIERLEDRAFMGSVMIFRSRNDATQGGLGYWLGEAYQRQRFMTEAATASVAAAFDRLAFSAIEAGAQPENAGSLAVMRRLGMRPIGSRMRWSSGRGREERCEYFAVTRAEFDAARVRDAGPR